MSADEDTELRDLVAQTLENNGVLGKIRAELRASVFLALEEQDTLQNKTPFVNQELNKFTGSKEGFLATGLVREFLEYFNLDFTAAVFSPETNFTEKYEGRDNLARALNIVESEKTRNRPLLCELMKRVEDTTDKISRQRTSSQTDLEDLTSKQIADARQKFQYYDKDNNGSIDKDELRGLFMDIFPHFHKNMLERYVNDEFQAGDRDFSNGIEFEEFLSMYRRLFVLCRGVVSHDVSDIVPSHRVQGSIQSAGNKLSQVESTGNADKEMDKNETDVKGHRSLSGASDFSDDAFFDEPVPKTGKTTNFSNQEQESPPTTPTNKPASGGSAMSSLGNMPPLGSSGMGSLAGAPPLGGEGGAKGGESPDWKDLQALDDKLDKLSFDLSKSDDGADDYEDDFQSSPGSQSQSQTQSQSHRSRKSSKSGDSISEEIIEDIDISGDDDFLASSQDKMDDITTDQSLSQLSQNGNFDYMEDAQVGS